jgi:hypothetical protein
MCECLVTSFAQLETAVEASKEGEVVVSSEAYALVSERISAAQRGASNYLVAMVTEPVEVCPQPVVPVTLDMEAGLRSFLPTRCVLVACVVSRMCCVV